MKPKIERRNKMKKNKGFTLIELLAVIVILAIIALIAVPVVMNIINRANKSAFKDSAYGLLKAGELFYTDSLLENAGNATETTFTFPDNIEGLEFKGSKPSKGSMTVNKDGKVAMAISNGKYCVTKGFEDDDVKITEDVENCEIIVPGTLRALATTGTFTSVEEETTSEVSKVHECAKSGICEPGTAFAIKVNNTETYKFYVLSDTGKEVTLIMDRNFYDEEDEVYGNVEWISEDDYEKANADDNTECSSVCTDEGPLTALKELKKRTSGWTNIPIYTYTLNDDSYAENYGPIIVENVRARLPKYSELMVFEFVSDIGVKILPSWLYENLRTNGYTHAYGYWLSTSAVREAGSERYYAANDVYYDFEGEYGSIIPYGIGSSNHSGIRPVITLSK